MQKADLGDAHEKLDRARIHINQAAREIRKLSRGDAHRFRLETDERTRRVEFFFDSLHQPSKYLNTVIGDAISNLRSVLDYVAVALVFSVTGKREDIGFPFPNDANDLKGRVRKGDLSVCDAAIQDFIINEVQPYNGGKGATLAILNKLRNIDKHRLLVSTTDIAGIRASFITGGITMEDGWFGMEAGQTTCIISGVPGDIHFTKEPIPTFEVRLKEPPHITDVSVIEFLNQASRQTQSVLDGLKSFT